MISHFITWGVLYGFGNNNVREILFETEGFVAGQFYGTGLASLGSIFVFAFINTGLSEEIFFRGFLGKRAAALMGFTAGNLVQGALFGLVHGVPAFIFTGNLMLVLFITLSTGFSGVLFGYLMKVSGGSIVLPWLVHAVMNFAVSLAEAMMWV
jgi:membrane protease YdiL (CAAX protease family)